MQLLEVAPDVFVSQESALSIKDLVVRYGNFTAVDHLTLDLRQGEHTVLVKGAVRSVVPREVNEYVLSLVLRFFQGGL